MALSEMSCSFGVVRVSRGGLAGLPRPERTFFTLYTAFAGCQIPGEEKLCERMTGLEKKRFRGTPVGEAEEGVKKKVVGFPFGGGSKEGERKLFGGVEERSLRLNVRQCGEG